MRSIVALLLACMMIVTVMGCGGSNQVGEGKLKTPDPRAKRYNKGEDPADEASKSGAVAGDEAAAEDAPAAE